MRSKIDSDKLIERTGAAQNGGGGGDSKEVAASHQKLTEQLISIDEVCCVVLQTIHDHH